MPNTIKSILSFLLLLLSLSSVGQIYPVQVTTQLARPYSLYLSDYTAPGSERITVNIFLTDVSRTDLNIRLRLRIEGQGIKIETKPEFVPPLLTVHGGAPLQLISSDLVDYFEPRNLNFSGISQREYEQKGSLPEGLYQFCFEVYEYNRNVKISNSSCSSAWLILNDPPLVNLPGDGEKIRIQSPQQVIFQWTPRHMGSPNAAFTTEYDFKLVEVWPSTRNPNDAILTSPPIYQTTTTSTTVIYGPAETALEPGRRYAFQIKAHSIAGTSELNLFKNNGLSQVSSFVFGDACIPPVNIIADATGATRFTAKWDEGLGQTAYNLRYRLAQGGDWYTTNTINPDVEVNSLQPNTRYEYQVSATCGILESAFSSVASITTKSNPPIVYSCGVPLSPFNLDPAQLLDVLKVGDIIQAGDFDVTITKVTGGNGNFSGEGVIPVSYFNQAKVKAEFSGITVNKEMRMVNGYLNVTGAGVDVIPSGVLSFMDKLSESLEFLDSALNKYEENLPKRFDPTVFVADKAIVIPGAIVSVTPATDGSGAVVVVDDKGNKQTIPAGTTAAITDSKGKGYLVDKQGGVHETTAAIAAKAGKREYNFAVKFSSDKEQAFGFDELGTKSALAATYDKLDGKYDVAWKSVAAGQTDKVQAIVEGSGIDKSKVHFEQFGQPLTSSTSGANAFSLNVQGKTDGTTEGLVALYTPADTTKKEQVLGQLNVVTYNEIPKTVVIVPVNDSDGSRLKKVGDKATLQTELNKIYGQAVTKWSVNFADNITVPGIEPFEDGGSGLLSNYTSHMRQVISAYKANMQPNTYYLFLVSTPKDPNTLGVMPRSKESGFIFVDKHADAAAIARTMAHELGHGAFNLHHTFMEPKLTQAKGTTDNLMDYPAGDKLYKYQWDKMRYPDIVVGLFESDEEGRNATVVNLEGLKDFANKDVKGNIISYTFLARSGKPISLPPSITSVTFSTGDQIDGCSDDKFRVSPFGTISKFKVKDEKGIEKEFTPRLNCSANLFIDYQSGDEVYYDELTNSSITKAIVGFPFVSSGELLFKVGQIGIETVPKTEKYTSSGTYQPFDFLSEKIKTISKFNEVYASFSPDYDQEVKQFILDNIKKEGFDGVKFYDNDIYVFTHATQLQKYSILKGCFRTGVPGELLKLIQTHVNEYLPTPGGGPVHVEYDAMTFSYSHEEDANNVNAKSLVNHWKKYDFNYYPIISKAVNNFTIPKTATASEVYDLLKPISGSIYSDNWNCFWDKIGANQRIELIEQLIPQNSAGDNTEEMILLLITTVHGTDEQLNLIKTLEDPDYKSFRKIWNVLDSKERLKLSFELTKWLKKYRWPGDNYANDEYDNFWDHTVKNTSSSGTNDNFFHLFNQNWVEDFISKFEVNFKDGSNDLSITFDLDPTPDGKPDYYNWTGKPFDWIVLKIMDDFPSYGLTKGDLITVPAVLIFGIDQNIDKDQNLAALRVLGDVVAIALAPVTAGGSTAILFIEVGAATIDIVITTNRTELDNYLGKDAGVIWDVMYGAWNIFTLGRSFFVPTVTVVNGIERVSGFSIRMQWADKVASDIAAHGSLAEKTAYIERLNEFINVLRGAKLQNQAQAIEAYYKVLELRSKIERTLKASEIIIDITVENGNLVVNGALSLGKIDFINSIPTLTQNIRWLPQTVKQVRLLDQYNNIATVVNGTTLTEKLSVVEDVANTGQVYVTRSLPQVVESFPTKLDNILSSSTTFNKLFSELKKLPGTDRRVRQYTSLESFRDEFIKLFREADQTAIKNLDQVLDDFEYFLTQSTKVNKQENVVQFLDEMMESSAKFKAAATSLEVIKNPAKYINNVDELEDLEDLISSTPKIDGEYRFDIKFKAKSGTNTISVFVDTKNYSSASQVFSDLSQINAYFRKISSFDEFIIVQQSRTSITLNNMQQAFRNALLKDVDGVFMQNPALFQGLNRVGGVGKIRNSNDLELLIKNDDFFKSELVSIIKITQ